MRDSMTASTASVASSSDRVQKMVASGHARRMARAVERRTRPAFALRRTPVRPSGTR